MKWLLILLAVLAVGVFIALTAQDDPGYVRITFQGYTIESTALVFVGLIVIAFLAVYYVLRALSTTRRMPRRVRQWKSRRRLGKAHDSLAQGMLDLVEGRWREAEHLLTRHADSSDLPMLNYLAAAQAAQHQGAVMRADNYLQRAKHSGRNAEIAVELAAVELQLQRGEPQNALPTLQRLRGAAPKHPKVIALLLQTYMNLRDWEHLLELLSVARKYHVIPEDEIKRLEISAWTELLASAATENNGRRVQEVWSRVPKALHTNETLVYAYASQLIACGEDVDAMVVLRKVISWNWSDALVYLYGIADGGPEYTPQQLHSAEDWLRNRTGNPVLLLTLGRLALRNGMPDKAKSYLEASINAGAQPETYRDLGALLEQLGESDRALLCYQKGLSLMTGGQPMLRPQPPAISDQGGGQPPLLPAR